MQRLRSFVLGIFAFALLFIVVGGVGWLIYQFFRYISAVPKELGAALITAATTILVATATVMIGRYYERRKELDALYRDKKIEIYDEFLKKFFSLFYHADKAKAIATEEDLGEFLQEFTRKLVLWSGPEVIEAFVKWKDHLKKGEPDANSILLAEDFLKAIRSDLRNSNNGLHSGFFAKLFLKESDLFLLMAAKNPNIKLAELAEIEKAIQSKRETGAA